MRKPKSLWVSDRGIEPEIADLHGERRLVILIHGYNNDKQQAEESYASLRDKLATIVPAAHLDTIWSFFWPGYVEALLPGLRRHVMPRLRRERVPTTESNLLATLPFYALQVSKAQKIGEQLGRYLLSLVGSDFVLIAHSLGCRVALEVARTFAGEPTQQKRLKAICLMAAAVPTYMIEVKQRLMAAAKVPERTYVLYSRKDTVLRWMFPPGQTMAGEGWLPNAVGRHGQPPIWTGTDETMLGHSDYWKSPVTRPHLARLFGVATLESLPEFNLLEWPGTDSRELPSASLPSHTSR